MTANSNPMLSPEELLESTTHPENEPDFVDFYDLRDTKDGGRSIRINYHKLINLLKQMGYRRYDVGGQFFLVQIEDNVVEQVVEDHIVDNFIEYIQQFPDNLPDGVMKEALLNKIYGGISTYFSKNILHRLTDKEPITFSNHTRDSAYFYYRNGYVKVTKEAVRLLPYSQLEKKIWKNQILDRDFKYMEEPEWDSSTFTRFVKNISNNWKERPDGTVNIPDTKRYEVFKGMIGYLLHGYFDGKLKSIIFTDSRVSDDPSGRTGKTLIFKAMGHMLNATKTASTFYEINGKDFDQGDRFKYQKLGLDTRLVHLNDVKRDFVFENLFNDITEGIQRQRKNETPVMIYAKIGISTNLTIRIHGDSAKDRCIEFEMADYYSEKLGPDKEFGEWFFRDWSKEQWHQFDNFMLHCMQCYLKNGLSKPRPINLNVRKLQEETCQEFILWMEDLNIKHQEEYDKKTLYEWFIRDHSTHNFKNWLEQRIFTKWLRLYADFHEDFEGYKERRSNNRDFIRYIKKSQSEGHGKQTTLAYE